jgi:hypothetical protein
VLGNLKSTAPCLSERAAPGQLSHFFLFLRGRAALPTRKRTPSLSSSKLSELGRVEHHINQAHGRPRQKALSRGGEELSLLPRAARAARTLRSVSAQEGCVRGAEKAHHPPLRATQWSERPWLVREEDFAAGHGRPLGRRAREKKIRARLIWRPPIPLTPPTCGTLRALTPVSSTASSDSSLQCNTREGKTWR